MIRHRFAAAVDGLLKEKGFDPELGTRTELEMLGASTFLTLGR